jgi:class 3 adenylate cyclase
VVTFLFTDVEGSTRRWEADADAMRTALAAHDEVLRTAIEKHDGFLFKHTGDGVCAAFSSPKSAVDAAVAAQRELKLPVRMGLATGEAELRDGDYFGAVLNRAARVMAAGHGGQILLDGTTAGLCSSIDLIALGHGDYVSAGWFRLRSRRGSLVGSTALGRGAHPAVAVEIAELHHRPRRATTRAVTSPRVVPTGWSSTGYVSVDSVRI